MNAIDVLRRIHASTPRNTPGIRAVRREISKELKGQPGPAVIALAQELVRSGDSNGRWVGYELVQHHPEAMKRITGADVERLAEGLADWGGVDSFGCFISGPAWREARIDDARVHRWARSKDRWKRRAALVSTVPLNVPARGGHGDPERTLSVCELLLDDRDDMVVKALSWALRALAAQDPDSVAEFMETHEGRLPARVKREVAKRLGRAKEAGRRR